VYERHFSSFFYVHVTREKLPKHHSYEKYACKMLMKLTPGRESLEIAGCRFLRGRLLCFVCSFLNCHVVVVVAVVEDFQLSRLQAKPLAMS